MGVRTQEIVGQIRTASQAQEAIATLLQRFATDTAVERLTEDARFAKQTVDESANRVAGNLLTSLVVRKPGGFVENPTRLDTYYGW